LKCLTGSGSAPVLFEFLLVELGPGEDEAELPATEAAVDYLKVVDPDLGHCDRDPEEAAYRRHELIMARAAASFLLGFQFEFRS
jgi:hypothetical protein